MTKSETSSKPSLLPEIQALPTAQMLCIKGGICKIDRGKDKRKRPTGG